MAAAAGLASARRSGAAPRPPGPRFLAFSSNRPGGAGAFDLYLYDRHEERLLPLPGVNCPVDDAHPVLSGDGGLVAFTSARHPSKLRPGGIFLYDRRTEKLVDLPGINSELCGGFTAMSRDARFFGFTRFDRTEATPRGTLFPTSIQLYDRRSKSFATPDVLNPAGGATSSMCLSGDGRWLAGVRGTLTAENHLLGALVLYDRKKRTFADPPPVSGPERTPDRNMPGLSGDGRLLAFTTRPTPAARWDIAVYDRKHGEYLQTPGLNSPEAEEFPSLSRDGRYLAFETRRGDNIDVGLYDLRDRRLLPVPGLNSELKDRHPALSQE